MFATKFSIDWSDYLRTVTPTSTHKYTLADPVVFVQKIEYLKRMNELLAKTPDRTLINYVVIQYLKSWLPVLSKPHTDVIDEFLAKSQHYVPTRADRCVAFVKSKMPVAVGAMFARATSSEKIKPAASEILNETVEAFKSTIESNTWMDKQTKKAIMSKVNRMERRVSHSEILMSNRKLDDYYFHKNVAFILGGTGQKLFCNVKSFISRPGTVGLKTCSRKVGCYDDFPCEIQRISKEKFNIQMHLMMQEASYDLLMMQEVLSLKIPTTAHQSGL
ncbi:hypothetical protein Y032_0105g3715 [Ancylostoma ceylanicum]|uniref:Peptidase M13 N-terminal domain-containing protein n=1 Tax=Ancylostoma ceylanicum TaxID=53326 RepID=A0A016TGD5_9BILA|nr:hypothetical protein Y032_0105g3715 [Ancylostoma ceylanicum]